MERVASLVPVCSFAIICLLLLKFIMRRPVDLRWGVAGISFLALNYVVLITGKQLQLYWAPDIQWNWFGKISALALTLAVLKMLRGKENSDFGLRLRQNSGSVLPSTLVLCALFAWAWGIEAALSPGTAIRAETIAYQAIMPGFEEELTFRAVLLYIFSRSLFSNAGEETWWLGAGPLLVSLLFGLLHAVSYQSGSFGFNTMSFIETAVFGLGLMWIRLRTGSLVLPILGHNLANVGAQFF